MTLAGRIYRSICFLFSLLTRLSGGGKRLRNMPDRDLPAHDFTVQPCDPRMMINSTVTVAGLGNVIYNDLGSGVDLVVAAGATLTIASNQNLASLRIESGATVLIADDGRYTMNLGKLEIANTTGASGSGGLLNINDSFLDHPTNA